MPSSTSSSNDRIPVLPYSRIILTALAICCLLTAALAWFEQGKQQVPSVGDGPLYWGLHRERVYSDADRKKLVIVGMSRSHCGIDPQIMANMFDRYAVVMLSLSGIGTHAVVQDLVADDQFNGIILYDTTEFWMLPQYSQEAAPYLRYYHQNFSNGGIIEKRINARIKLELQKRFVVLSPGGTLYRLLWSHLLQGGGWIRTCMRPDRFRQTWFDDDAWTKVQYDSRVQEARNLALDKPDNADELVLGRLPADLSVLHKKLQQRGGDLILVRMPSSRDVYRYEEAAYPKTKYWDPMVQATGISAVHFMDDPELRSFVCADGSHLDARVAPAFTRRLAVILGHMIRKKPSPDHQSRG